MLVCDILSPETEGASSWRNAALLQPRCSGSAPVQREKCWREERSHETCTEPIFTAVYRKERIVEGCGMFQICMLYRRGGSVLLWGTSTRSPVFSFAMKILAAFWEIACKEIGRS